MWYSGQVVHTNPCPSSPLSPGPRGEAGRPQARPLGGTVAPWRAASGSPRTGHAEHKRWRFQGVRGEFLDGFTSSVEFSLWGVPPPPRWRLLSDGGLWVELSGAVWVGRTLPGSTTPKNATSYVTGAAVLTTSLRRLKINWSTCHFKGSTKRTSAWFDALMRKSCWLLIWTVWKEIRF